MIQLKPDFLLFRMESGESIPCSAETVTVELMGEAAELVDPNIIKHAASAVMHYFKEDLSRDTVSVGEFASALEKVLQGLGFSVFKEEAKPAPRIVDFDLRVIASESGKGFELFFFDRLRAEICTQLKATPDILRFCGLRGSVKQLLGARRWTPRCQTFSDEVVEFLRVCLQSELPSSRCGLIVF